MTWLRRESSRRMGRLAFGLGVVAMALCVLVGCGSEPPPFSGHFGVCAESVAELQAQLDAIGDVWYYDYHFATTSATGHQRLFMIRFQPLDQTLEAVIRANPGAWWAVGNEPNDPHQDDLSPEAYAARFHEVAEFIRRADPSCQILPAGLANADWRWAREFREAYRRRYGRYPVVAGWNIHNYLLEPGIDPYDVAEFKRRIVAFRHWMLEIGEEQKPLFLTEFGVLYGAGCCDRPVDPPERTVAFMRETVQWLATTSYVQHWAWFILNNAGEFNGGLYEEGLTLYGQAYRDLVQQYAAP